MKEGDLNSRETNELNAVVLISDQRGRYTFFRL